MTRRLGGGTRCACLDLAARGACALSVLPSGTRLVGAAFPCRSCKTDSLTGTTRLMASCTTTNTTCVLRHGHITRP
ncbi:hypothetical protein DMR_32880 [Solidesulfovibrio magneticus RS-1]|uniref:Uncharacterized protein n=1 Tax=Solidesulfovibrio magneticus (strain ATCC 700980 / DSM 13731 / RS-1) TaxID=573370 RepID=C4XJN2_SOLM1|nr:hypothetical protein DMR_32880 [Solidesulfovibrio magneticus RS-1]